MFLASLLVWTVTLGRGKAFVRVDLVLMSRYRYKCFALTGIFTFRNIVLFISADLLNRIYLSSHSLVFSPRST
jgi:hypothetical protein